MPGIERELPLARQLLQTITRDEVAAYAREVLPDTNRVVLASAPRRPAWRPSRTAQLSEALSAGLAATVTAWRDEASSKELMTRPARPGTVQARREIQEIGVTVLTLSNGVEVWLKPTEFRNDQIIFTSYARGGVSLASEADYLNASLGNSFVGVGGVGGFTPVDLGKMLAGRLSGANAYLSTYLHGVTGSTTPRTGNALQLAYLDLHRAQSGSRRARSHEAPHGGQPGEPGAEPRRRVRGTAAGREHRRALHRRGRSSSPTCRSWTRRRCSTTTPRASPTPPNFTFFFVGSFKVDDVAPLIATYLGSLPSKGAARVAASRPAAAVPHIGGTRGRPEGSGAAGQHRHHVLLGYGPRRGGEPPRRIRRRGPADAAAQRTPRGAGRHLLGGRQLLQHRAAAWLWDDADPVRQFARERGQAGGGRAGRGGQDAPRRPHGAEVRNIKEGEKNDIAAALTQNGFWLNSLQSAHVMGRDPS